MYYVYMYVNNYYENMSLHWKAPLSMNNTVVGIVADIMALQPTNIQEILKPFRVYIHVFVQI